MEPFTYFFNAGITLAAYSYYILAKRALDFNSVDDHLRSKFAKYDAAGVNVAEYERLAADVARYERYVARISNQPVTSVKDDDDD